MFIVDNKRFSEIFGELNKSQYYQFSNQQIIDNLCDVSSLCYQNSYVSNFDKYDFMGILEERGVSMISRVQSPIDTIYTPDLFSDLIRHSMSKVCSPIINDSQIVKAAILGKVSPEFTKIINCKNIFKNNPYDLVEAYYHESDNHNFGTFYTVLSGLSFPMERLNDIEKNIGLVEKELIEKVENSRSQTFESNNWSSKFKKSSKTKENLSLSQRLDRFK
jgi:hypothetical protein